MKKIIIPVLLSAIIASCNQAETNKAMQIPTGSNTELISSEVQILEEINSSVRTITVGDIQLNYSPLNIVHSIENKVITFSTRDGQRVAEARIATLDDRPLVDDSGRNPIFLRKGKDRQIEIEIFDMRIADEILAYNFKELSYYNNKSLNGDIITISKRDNSIGLQGYLAPIDEAPIQYLTVNTMDVGVKKIGTYEFWFDEELKMVRSQERESLKELSYTVAESIDLLKSKAENFQVNYEIKSLDEDYNLFTMEITNDFDSGLFVTSNPIESLSTDCANVSEKYNVKSVRIENGIRYSLPIKKGAYSRCFNSEMPKNKITVFDSKLNFIKVKF